MTGEKNLSSWAFSGLNQECCWTISCFWVKHHPETSTVIECIFSLSCFLHWLITTNFRGEHIFSHLNLSVFSFSLLDQILFSIFLHKVSYNAIKSPFSLLFDKTNGWTCYSLHSEVFPSNFKYLYGLFSAWFVNVILKT